MRPLASATFLPRAAGDLERATRKGHIQEPVLVALRVRGLRLRLPAAADEALFAGIHDLLQLRVSVLLIEFWWHSLPAKVICPTAFCT